MPVQLCTIFNYSHTQLSVANTETGASWTVAPGQRAVGNFDRMPWDTHGVLRISAANGQSWDAVDRDWWIVLKIPGHGESQAAKIPNNWAHFNLDFFDGGPTFTFI